MTNQALIAAIINNGVPALMLWMRQRHEATGDLPTDAEVIAKFHADADRLIAEGEAELRAKGVIA